MVFVSSFCPVKPTFFSSFLVLCRLRAIFRGIFRVSPSALPFLHCMKAFPIRASLILHALPHPYLPIYPLRPSLPPSLFTTPPLSFSFLPTFPSPSPINARTRAPSRTTRVRVRPHTHTRQEVFVYCLHLFTHPSQSAVHQHIKCEEKREKAFTKRPITS